MGDDVADDSHGLHSPQPQSGNVLTAHSRPLRGGNVTFQVFWFVALLSNIAASAQYVAVVWGLAAEYLPAAVLLLNQVSGVVGTLLGVRVGSRLTARLGHRRTIALSSTIEALGCLAVAVTAYAPGGVLTMGRAVALALITSIAPFAAGIGGPAWVALVADWPGTRRRTQQLLLDSTQFQLGRFLGPLVGAAVLAATALAIQWLSIANAATYLAIAILMLVLRAETTDLPTRPSRRSWRSASAEWLRSPPVWGLAAIALSADAARVFFPRVLRQSGESQTVYSASVSALALAAVVSAAIASRATIDDKWMSIAGLGGMGAALCLWSAGGTAGYMAWVGGAIVLGASVSVATASLTSTLMANAGAGRQSAAAATAMVTRTAIGSGGAALMAVLVTGLGALAFIPLACVAAVVTAAYASRRERPSSVDVC